MILLAAGGGGGGRGAVPPNKGMKQTKPAQAKELRSLSPVFGGLDAYATLVRRDLA
jgi:hypothetical protein